jgi:hypothetical protein
MTLAMSSTNRCAPRLANDVQKFDRSIYVNAMRSFAIFETGLNICDGSADDDKLMIASFDCVDRGRRQRLTEIH